MYICECFCNYVVTVDEIYRLYEAFMQISSSRVDDGVIDEQFGV